MYKNTLTYDEYYKLNKDSVEDMINSLLKDDFKKYPFLTFKGLDFGRYWDKIEEEIRRYPDWGHIPDNNFSSDTEIKVIYDLDKSKGIEDNPEMATWQKNTYDNLEDYFRFFKLTKVIPNIKLDFI